jgi:5-methylcytosine-specific restriction enzyme A
MTRYDFIKPSPRKKITTRERAEIFFRAEGICHLCGLQIRPGEEWDVSHPETSLWAGGSDKREDLRPAHRNKCHRSHTAVEATQRAKEARVRAKFLGASKPKGKPMPGGRNSPFKRKMNGKTVKRHES